MSIKLSACNCNPELDVYHQDTCGVTWTKLWIDPRAGTYGIDQEDDDGASPAGEWNGLVLATSLDNRPNEVDAREYLRSDTAKTLVKQVIKNWEMTGEGRGELKEQGHFAWEKLIDDLNSLPDNNYSLWSVEDWCHDGACQCVKSNTTDEELEEIAEEFYSMAECEHVILTDDEIGILDYLRAFRSDIPVD
jgi:hypothetical protein